MGKQLKTIPTPQLIQDIAMNTKEESERKKIEREIKENNKNKSKKTCAGCDGICCNKKERAKRN